MTVEDPASRILVEDAEGNEQEKVMLPKGRGGQRYLGVRRKQDERLVEGAANPELGLPPLEDRTFLITGSTAGIGFATAEKLAAHGCKVLIHGKNEKKVVHQVQQLQRRFPKAEIDGFVADLSTLQEVRDFAAMVLEQHPVIHGLLNNAATMDGTFEGKQVATMDGTEETLAVNVLAPFLLTSLLLVALKASGAGRVVFSSSKAMGNAKQLRDLQFENSPWTGARAYAFSKLCDTMLAKELDQRYGDAPQLCFHAIEPGLADTRIMRHGASWGHGHRKGRANTNTFTLGTFPHAKHVMESFHALVEDDWQKVSGRCDIKEAEDRLALKAVASAKRRERLWEEATDMTGADWPSTLETGRWRFATRDVFTSLYDMVE